MLDLTSIPKPMGNNLESAINSARSILTRFLPNGVVAGGWLRDAVFGYSAKDMDVFVSSTHHLEIDPKILNWSLTDENYPDYRNRLITRTANILIDDIPVNIIMLKRNVSITPLLRSFDIGLCMIGWCPSTGLVITNEFIEDMRERKLTTFTSDCENSDEHIARIHAKFPWPVVKGKLQSRHRSVFDVQYADE